MPLRYAFALLVLLASAAGAQAQLSASASVDRTTLGAGEMLLLTLEVEGDLSGLREPEPPPTRNLALVQTTPQRRVELRIVDGRRTERTTLQWTYQPLGVGRARLGPIQVTADLGTVRTDPIRVQVVPQAQRPPTTATTPPYGSSSGSIGSLPSLVAPESGLEVRTEVSSGRPYVGEQVVVDYVLVYDPERFQPQESQLLGAWEAAGLWREEMDVPYGLSVPRPNAARTRYEVTIKRLAVFPARSGPLQIDPIALEVGGRRTVPSGGIGSSIFDLLRGRNTRFAEVRVEMPAVELEARPLPDGAPDSFAGAVGQYRMLADLDPAEAQDGEAVALRVDLRGTGNAALLEGPAVPLPDGLTRYDVDEDRRIFRGIRPAERAEDFHAPARGRVRRDVPPAHRVELLRPADRALRDAPRRAHASRGRPRRCAP